MDEQRPLRAAVLPKGELAAASGSPPPACTVVIFGASGDLTRRKLLPALYTLYCDRLLPDQLAIIGFARRPWGTDQFRAAVEDGVRRFARRPAFSPEAWRRFAAHLHYVRGAYDQEADHRVLAARINELRPARQASTLFYLATPPNLILPIVTRLAQCGQLAPASARVVVEKPFGADLDSARRLNTALAAHLREEQIFRIDHYLGKETVQNILVFRLGNAIFEHLWDRKYIDHVQITAAESIDVEGRGRFYDQSGVLRDIVQNHLLQVLALCAMEPPVHWTAEAIRSEKVKVLQALRPLEGPAALQELAIGQYEGYRDEPGVAPESNTPTFAALRLHVDNWRWQGVPFYVRAGKALKTRRTEVAFQFRPVPLCLFGRDDACERVEPNVLVLHLQPNEGIELQFQAKAPGDRLAVARVAMDFRYSEAFQQPPADAYERLLLDALRSDPTLFARWDEVEEAWRFITPVLQSLESSNVRPALYPRGAEGVDQADQLIRRDGRRWRPLA